MNKTPRFCGLGLVTLTLAVILAAVVCARDTQPSGVSTSDPYPAGPKNPPKTAPQPTIRLNLSNGAANVSLEVLHLKNDDLTKLAKANWKREQWIALFGVYVEEGTLAHQANQPALLGRYRIEQKVLRFEPRFPLQPGARYRARLDFSRLPDPQAGKKPLVKQFTLPKVRPTASTAVKQVYPSTNKLPENQLKFYIHFSAPMSRGEAYQRVHLLDAGGKEVESPFLELDEELWDPSHQRFTLFFHPGRVKRGLKPREEFGPILVEGKTYTFVVDKDWTDAQGNPLRESFKKVFSVGPPDDQPPDPKTWKIHPPPAGSLEPLTVGFPKPMDHAMLHRVIWVSGSGEEKVAGAVTVQAEETSWQFTPQKAWQAGTYVLVVEKTLEDLAGNTIGRPFEVDILHPIQTTLTAEKIRIPFQVVRPGK
jgi:hypothetical protein